MSSIFLCAISSKLQNFARQQFLLGVFLIYERASTVVLIKNSEVVAAVGGQCGGGGRSIQGASRQMLGT